MKMDKAARKKSGSSLPFPRILLFLRVRDIGWCRMGKILMRLCESISSIGTQLPVNTRVSQHRCRNTGVAACGKETDLLGMQTGISLFSKKALTNIGFSAILIC